MTDSEYILLVRRRLGLSQKKMGDKLSVTKQTIYAWENEKTDIPGITMLVYKLIAEKEGITINERKHE